MPGAALSAEAHAAPRTSRRPHPHQPDLGLVRKELEALVAAEGLPGAQAVLVAPGGRTWEVGAGAGDLATGRPFPHRSRLRVASHTKSFVATVVLQLAAAGRLVLDSPVERYLPGVIRGHGNDGRRMTVRQVLQHTAGLPDLPEELTEHRPGYIRPERVVALALRQRPQFPPGRGWGYSNTGYIVLGLLVERVTGRRVQDEVRRRVVDRLGLPDTYWPRWPEQRLRGPHPKAYEPVRRGGARGQRREPAHREVAFINTSLIGAAGALVSSAHDLIAFFTAQLEGRLLPHAQLAQMRATVPADIARGARYGLGLAQYPLNEAAGGGSYWGHGGTVAGTRTRGGVTEDGRAVIVAVNEVSENPDGSQAVVDTVERIFRSVPRRGAGS
ncbi:serine hydrolase domain-containing protein [Streptomyces sp. ODS28]|uniref:serine hydrolase domain-containing protein n=1 Tax=Streptomyces sp. ODS28 TaxID=3136688 RepID=UPI0031E53A2F